MEQRVNCDLYYIAHWSPWLDLKILVRTIGTVFRGDNAY
jgi:putative colanic acid biosynthesis UDP-glucose lipid carrier transferase